MSVAREGREGSEPALHSPDGQLVQRLPAEEQPGGASVVQGALPITTNTTAVVLVSFGCFFTNVYVQSYVKV